MVSTLVFALITAGRFSADPATRYDAFMKSHPSFVATVEASANGQVIGTGVARVSRPQRIRFDFTGKGIDFTLSSTELGFVELDRVEGVYDEHPSTGALRLYESRISIAPTFFPFYLLPPSLKSLFGTQKPTITSVTGGDELQVTIVNPMGSTELRLVVDAEGRPVRFSQKGQNGVRSWRLVLFKSSGSEMPLFRVEPPLGYVPFTLPELPYPLQVGEEAPLTGWKRAGKPFDLGEPQRGKARLLAVLGADCPASKVVRPVLAELAKSMPVLIIAPGEIVDPSGTLIKKLSPPGTPMFYLVGPDEKVTNLWFGFDPAKAADWAAKVKAAAKGK
jgi:hypothetical protein